MSPFQKLVIHIGVLLRQYRPFDIGVQITDLLLNAFKAFFGLINIRAY